ncbi:MAG: hypothetical protein CL565_00805 [Alphaproteobacteria bacterium]|nr:hypothetical protein [Alphaproteobacteria bacterium]
MRRALLLSSVCLLSACNYIWGNDELKEVQETPEEIWIMDHRDPSTLPPVVVEDTIVNTTTNTPVPVQTVETKTVSVENAGTAPSLPTETVTSTAVQTPNMPVRETLLKGDAARLVLLEEEVKRLRSEVGTLRNVMQKIMAADGQLKDLSLELERINQDYAIALSSSSVPLPAQTEIISTQTNTQTVTAPAAQIAPTNQVTNVRFGKNGAATRVVLDLAQQSQFTTDLDNTNGILVVELPGTFWAAQNSLAGSGVVEGITASTAANGTARMVIELNSPVTIQKANILPPSGQYGNRLYFDLLPQ